MHVKSRALRAITWLRATARRRWWTTFLIVGALCSAWSLSTPVFGAPDEPAHSIRAASVARLEILGEERAGVDDVLFVDAPELYATIGGEVGCYAFMRNVPASCATTTGSDAISALPTTAARHPPAYYFVAGLPTLAIRSVPGIYLMRALSAVLTAAFLATALVTLERRPRPRAAALGLLLASTPMVFFVGGLVNPSAAEIPASIALWITGVVLALEAATGAVDPRLVRKVGLAAIVVALSRQLAPLWLVVIAATLVLLGGRPALKALRSSRAAWGWGAAVAAATLFQVAWIAIVRPLDASLGDDASIRGLTTGSALRISFGESLNRLREMVGWFGWLDSPSPGLTYLLWALGLGALATIAVILGRRRLVIAAAAAGVVAVAAPIFFETLEARTAGFFWQGRYSMPIAVGVPLLLALSLATAPPRTTIPNRRAVAWMIGGVFVVGSVAAYGQTLRRNTVGYDGPLDFFLHPIWDPPVAPAALLLVALVLIVAYAGWVLTLFERPSGSTMYS